MINRLNPQLKLASDERFSKFVRGEKVYPINIEISPSHACQATCDWCFYAGTHEKGTKGMLDVNVLDNLIEELWSLDTKAITWTGGGEPTLYPDFLRVTTKANRLGFKQGLFTNALKAPTFNPEVFDWIRVSNTDQPWPINNMKALRRSTKVLGMAYNYTGNDDEVRDALATGKSLGVDYVQVRQALNLRGLVTNRLPPAINDPLMFVTTYKFDDSANPHGYRDCTGYNFVPFVWNNGNVDVCGYMRTQGSPYTMGNLYEKGIKQIIDEAPRSVPVIPSCQVCCKNHEINKLVDSARKLEDKEFV